MVNLLNPYEQFSLYPRDDYSDVGGLLSHDRSIRTATPEHTEQDARRHHPSAQPVDPAAARRKELRERLAS